MDVIKEKWDEILQMVKIEHDLTDISFKTWLQPLKVHNIDDDKRIVTILVPSEQIGVDYINKKYMFPIKVAIAELTGIEYSVEFIMPDQARARSAEGDASQGNVQLALSKERANLNPRYTFDKFVVGDNNKFAHAAALAVAESPGKMYNPLFIYGGAGLGKTHLMHSIAHFILDQNPEMNVLYVTSETFTNELIDAIRNGNNNNSKISSFREKYRSVDVLLIDDIQFISGKDATQVEFFHTFNELHGNNKQIIISSDKPPKEIETLETRLSSRFEWGILADISVPDFETRMAILRKKEETDGYDIDDEVIQYIANNIKSNIRELEGAFNKVVAHARLEPESMNMDEAAGILKDFISPFQNKSITAEDILSIVADYYKVTVNDLTGSKRNYSIMEPRQVSMYLIREVTSLPYKNIGLLLGKRDHSTVINGIKKIETEIETDEKMSFTINTLMKKINSYQS